VVGSGTGSNEANEYTITVPVNGLFPVSVKKIADESGVIPSVTVVGGLWGNGYVPGANEWSGGRVQNFTRVTAPQLGDVAAWGSKGQGHSGIYVGGGAVIYAHIFEGVKIQSVQFVNSKQNTQAAFNRYKP